MDYHFVNPQVLEQIDHKVKDMAETWDYPQDQRWQLWQMIATIESGLADKTFYRDGGIVHDSWNGHRNYPGDSCNADPYRAWGGFYRMEKAQMVGWTLYLVWRDIQDGKDPQDAFDRGVAVYRLHTLYWENEPRIWGFVGFEDFYTEAEANEALSKERIRKGFKRGLVAYLEVSGCYRTRVENSRAKPKLRDTWKERILP